MKKIGLVGGISWPSTIDYYTYINEGINAKLGGLNFAECIVYSLNFGELQEKTWEHSFELLLKACESLQRAGADAIVLCANTAHLFAGKLKDAVPLPFIHIVTATALAIKEKGLKKIGLLGTKFTMELPFYREQMEAHGLELIVPEKQKIRDYIQLTVKEELGRGIINPATKEKYLSIAKALIERGAEGIVLGCTEIPLLIGPADFTVPVFDTTIIHANAIVDFMLS